MTEPTELRDETTQRLRRIWDNITHEHETCLDCGRGGYMIHDLDGHPWCVHHGPFGPDTEAGDCCPHLEAWIPEGDPR